ncbi:MAG: hypothetical protein ONA90_10165 [candidate division KSB1 bacterium]|nr:hypothetical protein [candidate division KSB1 bacterium]
MRTSLLNKLLVAALIVAPLVLVSCDKNPTASDSGKPPKLPPKGSMALDLSLFTDGQGSGKAGAIGANFTNAAIRVLVINTVVAANLSVPVAVFAVAASQTPTLGSDGKFHWIYSVQHGGQTFAADLAGWLDVPAGQSVWEMYISTSTHQPPLSKFLWYSGRANFDGTSGYWEFFDDKAPASGVKVLRIDWQVAAEDHATLKFRVVKPNVPETGDELTYLVAGPRRTITAFDQSANTTLEITWDAQTGAGYLIAPDYNNGEKACWDEHRNDVACTN